MATGHITNGELFKKYRFDNRRPLSDKQIVCHGKLVSSGVPVDRFYRGWYPIRQCSYSHPARPAAGIKYSKDSSFKNYHVICEICDAPDVKTSKEHHHMKKTRKADRTRGVCRPCPLALACVPQQQVKGHSTIANAYWRRHDPHPWADTPRISAKARVHKNNWFLDVVNMEIEQNRLRSQYKKMGNLKPVGDFRSMNFFPQVKCEQSSGTTKAKTTKTSKPKDTGKMTEEKVTSENKIQSAPPITT